MRRSIVIALFVVAALAGMRIAGSSATVAADPDNKNEILKNSVLTDLDGEVVTLAQFAGKTVLIDIWETWCTPCLRSMPTLQKLMDDYPDDFVVLAVSPGYMDTPEQVREFVANHDYTFEFVFGEDLARDLNVQSIPFKVYVGPDGQYIESVLGTQGPDRDYEKAREIIRRYL